MSKVRKVVIPAAGFGTRFLPQTKAMPKEMLPVVDKPVIQYVVEELVEVGVEDVIIVTGANKRAIEDHFDNPSFELEHWLERSGKTEFLQELKRIAELANFIYLRQKGPYGNATPVRVAKHLLNGEPFFVFWGDEFTKAKPSRAQQMLRVYEKYEGSILGGVRLSHPDDFDRYGYVKGEKVEDGVYRVERIVEKPGKKNAPSDLAIVANYILTPDIFPILDKQKPGRGGEYFLAEAIDQLAKKKPVYAVEIENATYYDTGNKFEYLKTVVEFALAHPDLNGPFKDYLKSLKL